MILWLNVLHVIMQNVKVSYYVKKKINVSDKYIKVTSNSLFTWNGEQYVGGMGWSKLIDTNIFMGVYNNTNLRGNTKWQHKLSFLKKCRAGSVVVGSRAAPITGIVHSLRMRSRYKTRNLTRHRSHPVDHHSASSRSSSMFSGPFRLSSEPEKQRQY